jgi:hypothetical protein
MPRRVPLALRHLSHGLAAAVCLALAACSGGAATGPNHGPGEPGNPGDPGDGNGQVLVAGNYTLESINGSSPGQTVLLSNPDGSAIGLYRFDASSGLEISPLQTYTLGLRFEDEQNAYNFVDQGEMKWSSDPDGGLILTFESDTYGDTFMGRFTDDGVTTMQYDIDGDGAADTSLRFQHD